MHKSVRMNCGLNKAISPSMDWLCLELKKILSKCSEKYLRKISDCSVRRMYAKSR